MERFQLGGALSPNALFLCFLQRHGKGPRCLKRMQWLSGLKKSPETKWFYNVLQCFNSSIWSITEIKMTNDMTLTCLVALHMHVRRPQWSHRNLCGSESSQWSHQKSTVTDATRSHTASTLIDPRSNANAAFTCWHWMNSMNVLDKAPPNLPWTQSSTQTHSVAAVLLEDILSLLPLTFGNAWRKPMDLEKKISSTWSQPAEEQAATTELNPIWQFLKSIGKHSP